MNVSCAGEHILGDVHIVRHLVLLVSPIAGSSCSFKPGSSYSSVSHSPWFSDLFSLFSCLLCNASDTYTIMDLSVTPGLESFAMLI